MGVSLGVPDVRGRGARLAAALCAAAALFAVLGTGTAMAAAQAKRHARTKHYRIHRYGGLDCNGYSTRQRPIRASLACTDIRGIRGRANDNTWHGRFFDHGHYIGHDEPSMVFLSSAKGSGDNVSWTWTLPTDPSAAPTVATPGSDVAHMFELTPATWFSMMMCDPNSYPQLPCTPESDANAPGSAPGYPGGGSGFMEMQFYPPGFAPWVDAPSADNTHWFSALTIDSLECTIGFAYCNPACTEPVNFAFVQTDGVPPGPPAPQNQTLASNTPNAKTLLMNPGDTITVHMFDAAVPGQPGVKAFEVVIKDLTTGQSGFMQASAQNGFENTSITDCSGTPFNFQPEYNTASAKNNSPWGANRGNITTTVETGHFTPCTSLTDPFTVGLPSGASDVTYKYCHGPYESASPPDSTTTAEGGDSFCFPAGDTHGQLSSAPDEVTGCEDNVFQNGDLDFDGSAYYPEWPVSTTPTATYPGSFIQRPPTSEGRSYGQFFLQTDLALSESTCTSSGSGCSVPPPNAPGKFYPYFTRVRQGSSCVIEFGNVSTGATYGKDAQYGTDQAATLGYPEFVGPTRPNTDC